MNERMQPADLNLLRVFLTLFEEQNVSRAALALGLSQPTVSARLMRLRAHYGDPLFINTGRGLVPTAKAVALAPQVRRALRQCEACLTFFGGKTQGTMETRQIVVGMSDDYEVAFASQIQRELMEKFPEIRLSLIQTNRQLAQSMLLERKCDLTVTSGGLNSTAISFVIAGTPADVMLVHEDSLENPDVRTISVEEYLSRPHILVQYGGYAGTVDQTLKSAGLKRNIIAMTSHFASLPWLIEGRLSVNLPEHVARALCQKCPHLRYFPQPVAHNQLSVHVAWRSDNAKDRAMMDVKDTIVEVLRRYPWPEDPYGNRRTD